MPFLRFSMFLKSLIKHAYDQKPESKPDDKET